MLQPRHAVAMTLLAASAFAFAAAYLIQDTSGANLELAPLFLGVSLLVASVRLGRARWPRR